MRNASPGSISRSAGAFCSCHRQANEEPMPEVIADTPEVNLVDVAATIRAELRNETKAGAAVLHHAMAAGDALNLAQANQHKTNFTWKQWVRQTCFISVRTAFVRQQLAHHRAEIEAEIQRVGDYLSIRAALRKITKTKKKPSAKPKLPPDVTSFLATWKNADHQTRVAILDAIGGEGLLGALSQQLRREIERRVLNLHRKASAKTNGKFNEQAAAALRQALSMQKTTTDKNTTAMGVAASLNMINNLLTKDGVDLNNIVGLVIDMQATEAKTTKKAA
jgi:hypothetical protein